MSLLPPKFQDPLLKTLGPPIRKEQENKPVEVEVSPGIWRVNGKLETRIPENETAGPVTVQHTINSALKKIGVSEIDIPLPEFKVGDRVKVIGGGFYEGEVGVIENVPNDYLPFARHTMLFYYVSFPNGMGVSCDKDEIEYETR